MPDTHLAQLPLVQLTPATWRSELERVRSDCQSGDPADLALVERLIATCPEDPDELLRRALGAYGEKRYADAAELLERACRLRRDPNFHNTLGVVYRQLGRFEDSEKHYRRSLEILPRYAEAHYNYGNLLRGTGRFEDAAEQYRLAIEAKPTYAEAYYNLGILLAENLNDRDGAIRQFFLAWTHKKDYFEPIVRLADMNNSVEHHLDLAIAFYKAALKVQPEHAEVWNSLGTAYARLGDVDNAVAAYRATVKVKPSHEKARNNLCFAMNYGLMKQTADIFREHLDFETQVASRMAREVRPHTNDPAPDRRLRVGYVSADFRRHSVSYFVAPLLAAHASPGLEVFFYANVKKTDDVTNRLRSSVHHWRDISVMSDEEVTERVRADGIDILVDLGGHTVENRLMVFARKPAPIQLSYIGYANTTGMSAMDYRITDDWADPIGLSEAYHSETLLRMRGGFLCYQPAANTPEVKPPPCTTRGHVTFGSFNNPMKLRQEVVDLWADLLRRVPTARFLLKGIGLGEHMARARVEAMFVNAGISPDRLEIKPQMASQLAHLDLYSEMDVALDPFPYNGTTTTCEALLMGVPMVTLAGERHAARVGVSLMQAVGLPELIATSPEHYVELAAGLGADLPRLTGLRAELRERLRLSSLCDIGRAAGELDRLYREVWKTWCRTQGS